MKYTLEQKRKIIVEEHFQQKKKISVLARQYGIDSNNLYELALLYKKHGEKVFEKHHNYYTPEFIQDIVGRVLVKKETVASVALDLCLYRSTVGTMVRKFKIYGKVNTMKRQKDKNFRIAANDENYEELKNENLRLKAELAYVKKLIALSSKKKGQR